MNGTDREGIFTMRWPENPGEAPLSQNHFGALVRVLTCLSLYCVLVTALWQIRNAHGSATPTVYTADVEESHSILSGGDKQLVIAVASGKGAYRAVLADNPSMWYGKAALTDDASRMVFVGARRKPGGGVTDCGLYVAEVRLDRLGRPVRAAPAERAVPLGKTLLYTIIPRWLCDGRRVTYTALIPVRHGHSVTHIFVADIETGKVRDLTSGFSQGAANPVFSRQVNRVAFTGRTIENGVKRWDIYTVRPDGSDLVRLTHPGNWENHFNVGPEWTADGRQIEFKSDFGSAHRIAGDAPISPQH